MTTVSSQRLAVTSKTGANPMFRSIVIWLLLLTVLLFPISPAQAQQPKKVPRIGYLSPVDAARESARSEGIRLALRELGHIEGQNIAIEYRYAEGKIDRYPELAAELVQLKVDIILVAAGGDTGIQPIKNVTKTIPIVMAGFPANPVEAGGVVKPSPPRRKRTRVCLPSQET